MALSKPGFYFLAKHSPWLYHVKLKNDDTAVEAMKYLTIQGYKDTVDFELIYESIGDLKGIPIPVLQPINRVMPSHIASKVIGVAPMVGPKRTAIIFFKDPKIASYIKLSYG